MNAEAWIICLELSGLVWLIAMLWQKVESNLRDRGKASNAGRKPPGIWARVDRNRLHSQDALPYFEFPIDPELKSRLEKDQ